MTEYRHAGAERYEWLVDFSKFPVGTNIDLRNLSNKNNVDYDNTNKVMRFQVVADTALPADTDGEQDPDDDARHAREQRGDEPHAARVHRGLYCGWSATTAPTSSRSTASPGTRCRRATHQSS